MGGEMNTCSIREAFQIMPLTKSEREDIIRYFSGERFLNDLESTGAEGDAWLARKLRAADEERARGVGC